MLHSVISSVSPGIPFKLEIQKVTAEPDLRCRAGSSACFTAKLGRGREIDG